MYGPQILLQNNAIFAAKFGIDQAKHVVVLLYSIEIYL